MKPAYIQMLVNDLERQLDEASSLDMDELASQIREIGFSCRMCGNCCRRNAGDNRVMLTCRDIEKLEVSDRCPGVSLSGMLPVDVEFESVPSLLSHLDQLDVDDQGRVHAFGWCLRRKDNGDCCFLGVPHVSSIMDVSLALPNSPSSISFPASIAPCASSTPLVPIIQEAPADECRCAVYESRPYLCRTYPFFIMDGQLEVSECEGLGQSISKPDARALARDLIDRYVCELKDTLLLYRNFECFNAEGAGKKAVLKSISSGEIICVVHHAGGQTHVKVRLKQDDVTSSCG